MGGAAGREERHAAAAPGDQDESGAERGAQALAACGERGAVVVQPAPGEGLGLLLVGRRAGQPVELAQSVAAVGDHHARIAHRRARRRHQLGHRRAVTIVGEHRHPGAAGRGGEARGERSARRLRHGLVGLAVVAHHLLLDAGRRAGEDAHLGRRRPTRHRHQAVDRHVARGEGGDELAAVRVVADAADRQRPPAQRAHVGHRVGAAAGRERLARPAQDQHRRLAADALRMSGDETVGDQVDEQEDRLALEGVDQLEQALDARRLECGGQGGSRSGGFCHEPVRRPGAQAPARAQRRTAVGYSGRVKVPSGRNPSAEAAARTGPR